MGLKLFGIDITRHYDDTKVANPRNVPVRNHSGKSGVDRTISVDMQSGRSSSGVAVSKVVTDELSVGGKAGEKDDSEKDIDTDMVF